MGKTNLNIKSLNSFIDEALKENEKAYGKEMVLLLGKTRVGKSTITNYMIEHPLKKEKRVAVSANSNLSAPAVMNNNFEAVTPWPQCFFNNQHSLTFCDTPGFEDTQKEKRIVNLITLNALIHNAKRIMGIMAVLDWSWIEHGTGEELQESARIFSQLLKNTAELGKSILFIINRAPKDLEHEEIIERLTLFKETKTKELHTKWKLQVQINLLLNTSHLKEHANNLSDALFMIDIMLNNPQNIILIDVFDHGDTRKDIIQKISTLQPLLKQDFDFSQTDKISIEFRENTKNTLNSFHLELNRFLNIPITLEAITKNIQKKEAVIKNIYSVIELIQRFNQLNLEITQFQQDLSLFDNSEELFYKNVPSESGKTFLRTSTQSFSYQDIPFIRADVSFSRGTFHVTKEDKKNGTYQADFYNDFWRERIANVKIFVEKRHHPEYSNKIKEININLNNVKDEKETCLTNISILSESIKTILTSFSINESINTSSDIQHLQNIISKVNLQIESDITQQRKSIQQKNDLFKVIHSKLDSINELVKFIARPEIKFFFNYAPIEKLKKLINDFSSINTFELKKTQDISFFPTMDENNNNNNNHTTQNIEKLLSYQLSNKNQ